MKTQRVARGNLLPAGHPACRAVRLAARCAWNARDSVKRRDARAKEQTGGTDGQYGRSRCRGSAMSRNAAGAADGVTGADPQGGGPPHAQRVTVALIPKASADLRAVVERTGMSQTDVVNRAVSLYEWVDQELAGGAELIVRRRDGRDHVVKLL